MPDDVEGSKPPARKIQTPSHRRSPLGARRCRQPRTCPPGNSRPLHIGDPSAGFSYVNAPNLPARKFQTPSHRRSQRWVLLCECLGSKVENNIIFQLCFWCKVELRILKSPMWIGGLRPPNHIVKDSPGIHYVNNQKILCQDF